MPSQSPSPAPTPPSTFNPDYNNPTFDPADLLNDLLPPLTLNPQSVQTLRNTPTGISPSSAGKNIPDLTTHLTSLLSQANAHAIRHSTTLTNLTDEILRCGSRLAYEVEVLRGETIALSEVLGEGVSGEIGRFVCTSTSSDTSTSTAPDTDTDKEKEKEKEKEQIPEPEYITNLRTLTAVRTRLEQVIKVFGDAMEWPLPPSETATTSSSLASTFISVSAPEGGSTAQQAQEEKGQEVARRLRGEISSLLSDVSGSGDGIAKAMRRVDELRVLAGVWKRTAEEKARNRFVDGLERMVEERRRAVEQQQQQQLQVSAGQGHGHRRQESEGPGGGIFRNLHRLREEIYLE